MTGKIIRSFEFLIIVLATTLNGQTVISGDLSKFVLDSINNPFIVEKDLEIPAKKKVTINEGCVFLFKQFTGINIAGSLTVNGTQLHPVVFTTINDSLYSTQSSLPANPFDWNGVIIDKNADSVVFKNFILMYSVYGIKSQKRDMTIKNGTFKANGQFHFTVFDKIRYIQDNIPYSFPDDSAAVKIGQQSNFLTTLSINSFPSSAEVYLNKRPGKKVKPDGITPATFKNPENASISLALFKKGYQDTFQLLAIKPNAVNNYEFSLSTLRSESIGAQNKLLNDRFRVQMGRYCFYTSPVLVVVGAGLLYYAGKNQDRSDEAESYLARSMLPNDPNYDKMQQQYTGEKSKANTKRGIAISSFVLAAAALGVGIYLYF